MEKKYPHSSREKSIDPNPDWSTLYQYLDALVRQESVNALLHGDSKHPYDQIAKRLNSLSRELGLPENGVQEDKEVYAHRVIFRISREGTITYSNWEPLQEAAEGRSRNILEFIDEAQQGEMEEALHQVFENGKKQGVLCNVHWPDRVMRPYSVLLTPLTRHGTIETAIAICYQQVTKQIATLKLERTREELRWLERINGAVNQSISLPELAELIVEAYYSFFNGLSCRLYRYDETTHSLEVIAGQVAPLFQRTIEDYTGEPYTSLTPSLEDENVYVQALRDGEIRVENDPAAIINYLGGYSVSEEHKVHLSDLTRFFFIQSLVIVPLKAEHGSLGLLVLCADRMMKNAMLESLGRFTNQVRMVVAKYRMQDDLEKTRNTYRDLFNRIPVGLYRSTPGGKFLQANRALVEILGYPDRQTLMEQNIRDLYVSPDERNKLLQTLGKEKIVRDTAFQLRRYDGSLIWVEDSTRVKYGQDGSIEYFEGILMDVTERKEAEELNKRQTKLLAEAEGIAQLGSWEHNLQTGSTFWSDQLLEVLGLPADTEVLDEQRLAACLHPEDRDAFTRSYASLMAHFDAFKQDVRIVKDREERYAQLACHVERDGEGKPKAIYGTVLDITELKRAERALEQSNKELKRQNTNLEQFSYVISHNLRAPVANLIGLAQVLDSLELEKTAKDMTARLIKVADHLDETIRDLNEILAIRDARSTPKEPLKFARVLDKVIASIQNLVEENDTIIEQDFTKAPEVRAVEGYIQNILYNLVLNAIKYRSPDRQPVIKVSSTKRNGHIQLAVADNGLGIDLKAQGDKIFNLYQRFHLHTEGKGIGLYLVKTQVESLGGQVDLESEPGRGTTFYIHLPA